MKAKALSHLNLSIKKYYWNKCFERKLIHLTKMPDNFRSMGYSRHRRLLNVLLFQNSLKHSNFFFGGGGISSIIKLNKRKTKH